jgi:hypothetical protein
MRRLIASLLVVLTCASGELAARVPAAPASTAPYTIAITALMGPSLSDVYIQVISTDPAFPLPSQAKKIQVKALKSDGSSQWTNNYNDVALDSTGTAHFQFANLADGQTLSAQVSIQTPLLVSVEVSRSVATDLLRPNVQIDATGPSTGNVGQTLEYQATFTEINGQCGATFDAVLLADGVEVDRVTLTVPAGGSVSPQDPLTATFSTANGHAVDILVDNFSPASYQPIAPVHFDVTISGKGGAAPATPATPAPAAPPAGK